MNAELAAIIQLRKNLREAIGRLAVEAHRNPESRAALEYLRLVTRCEELEREINIAIKSALEIEAPKGTG